MKDSETIVDGRDELIAALDRRLTDAEAKLATVQEGFEFAAESTRGVYGVGALLSAVFDAIAKQLKS